MNKCPHCKKSLRKKYIKGRKEFLRNFQVGSNIYWHTGKMGTITALGINGFLYFDNVRNKENKSTYDHNWYKSLNDLT